jgi:hypothetical protein
MRAFVITVNGTTVCTAGVATGVLTATVLKRSYYCYPLSEFLMQVGALDTNTDENLEWSVPDLNIGDEVTIKIVECTQVDPEQTRSKAPKS